MKVRRLIDVVIAVLFVTAMVVIPLYAQMGQTEYSFKSAIVKYQVSGSQNGEQELYINNHGKKTCMIMNVTVTMGSFTNTTNMMNIANGNDYYYIDLEAGTGTKTTMTPEQKEQMMGMLKQMMPAIENITESWNKVGTETILGKSCDIYEEKGMKVWIWNNLSLKSEISFMGMNTNTEAVSLDVDVNIPASKFEPPAGVTIEERQLPDEMPTFSFEQE